MAIKHTHTTRSYPVEAWHYTGQPRSEWPYWIERHHSFKRSDSHIEKHKGEYALRDDEGEFWRWYSAEKFNELYVPLPK